MDDRLDRFGRTASFLHLRRSGRPAWTLLAAVFILTTACAARAQPAVAGAIRPATAPALDLAGTSAWAGRGIVAPFAHPSSASTRPASGDGHKKRMLIISIDGLRPDVLLRLDSGETPRLRGLYRAGSYTFWAQTTVMAVTLPSHVSMLTGVVPRRHEVEWNKDLPNVLANQKLEPRFLTLFERAKCQQYTTALAAGKSKFDIFNRMTRAAAGRAARKAPALDWFYIPEDTIEDEEVAEEAARIIRRHAPQVMFVHFPGVDTVGHAVGWGTRAQERAVKDADAAVGVVLDALDEAGVRDATYILVTADHGGAGYTHLAGDARARHIPWILVGPGVRKNLDLTHYERLTVNTEDTCVTACRLLDIPLPHPNTGERNDPGPDGVFHEEVLESWEAARLERGGREMLRSAAGR